MLSRTESSRSVDLSFILLFSLILLHPVYSQRNTLEKRSLVNSCIDGFNHKTVPGPEDELHKQCLPWKDNSCCTGNTTVKAHGGNMYGFNYNHCIDKPKMSKKCHEHFIQDLCFYECSPNVGPWIQSVSGMKIRRERFFDVPLCATDCDQWFDDCRNDYTCTDNWTLNFKWKNGTNHCPPESECRTFADVFVNASNFCERVWDHSWKYTDNAEPCMRIWFDGSQGNPNEGVARWKINQMNSSSRISSDMIVYILPALVIALIKMLK